MRPEVLIRRNAPGSPFTYADADRQQREIAERARAGGAGALLLFEPAPTITLGRRAGADELRAPRSELESRGIAVASVDRGGLATYHGPGQWVAFPVDTLERLTGDRRGVRKAVDALLGAALDTARSFEPKAEIRDGCELGVWGPRGKLASVGVHIEQGVLLHGLALNVYPTPESFFGLRPCGLDAPVGFLANSEEVFEQAGERLKAALFERFWSLD